MAMAIAAAMALPRGVHLKFSGKPTEYWGFIRHIETHADPAIFSARQRLDYVVNSCVGAAREAVAPFEFLADAEDAYLKAKAALKECFGTEHVIVNALMRGCLDGDKLKSQDLGGLKLLSIKMRRCEVTLTEFGKTHYLQAEDKLLKIHECHAVCLKKFKSNGLRNTKF